MLLSPQKWLQLIHLVSSQQLGAENNVAGLVDSVDVSKGCGDGEHGADGAQSLVDLPDLVVEPKNLVNQAVLEKMEAILLQWIVNNLSIE